MQNSNNIWVIAGMSSCEIAPAKVVQSADVEGSPRLQQRRVVQRTVLAVVQRPVFDRGPLLFNGSGPLHPE